MEITYDVLWVSRCIVELVLMIAAIKLVKAYTLKTEER